ncbi:hypothetical protein HPB47_005333 [Ixodes persulcatus]|uniref:Uncharacterized protein n=1 Tax=Ixodes persulcatus TaxID=34615 RepID=A0AC60PDD3_IXOPE|nr:hypothetical protein HPB47_005333 [Ixodes persulcatus]
MTSLLWNAQTAEARAAAVERAAAAAPARQLCSRLGGSEARAVAYGSPCGGFESRPSRVLKTLIAKVLFKRLVHFPVTSECHAVMRDLYAMGQLPGVTGWIDCTHVRITSLNDLFAHAQNGSLPS